MSFFRREPKKVESTLKGDVSLNCVAETAFNTSVALVASPLTQEPFFVQESVVMNEVVGRESIIATKSNRTSLISPKIMTSMPDSKTLLLEELPRNALDNLVNMLAPNLSKIRLLNKLFQSIVDEYVEKKVKRFKDSTEEAECWEHRPPQFNEHLELDPLVLKGIIFTMFECKLLPDLNKPILTLTTTPKDITRLAAKTQKTLFKSLRLALNNYDTLSHAILPLRDAIKRNHLHYYSPSAASPNTPNAISSEGSPTIEAQMDQQRPSFSSLDHSGCEIKSRDTTWTDMNTELYLLAAHHGHVHMLPPLSDLNPETIKETLCTAMESSIKGVSASMVLSIIEMAKIAGYYWLVLDRAVQVCQACLGGKSFELHELIGTSLSSRSYQTHKLNVILVLLDALFNDDKGPFRLLEKYSFDYSETTEREMKRIKHARLLVEEGEDVAKSFGIQWHQSRISGQFQVLNAAHVCKELKQKLIS